MNACELNFTWLKFFVFFCKLNTGIIKYPMVPFNYNTLFDLIRKHGKFETDDSVFQFIRRLRINLDGISSWHQGKNGNDVVYVKYGATHDNYMQYCTLLVPISYKDSGLFFPPEDAVYFTLRLPKTLKEVKMLQAIEKTRLFADILGDVVIILREILME
jgi:hypothetical protein